MGGYFLTKISIRAKHSICRFFYFFIFPSPFFVNCPYKGRINWAKGALNGIKPQFMAFITVFKNGEKNEIVVRQYTSY